MQRLDVEGVSKARRTVQKYLKRGEIDARLVPISNGQTLWLANELDLARFIEELKRKEALALYSKPGLEMETISAPIGTPEPILSQEPAAHGKVALETEVEQLSHRLEDAKSEIAFLRGAVQDANAHVKLWSDRASELKDLLQAQTDNNAPVLAAFAASLHAQAERKDAPVRDTASIEARPIMPGASDDRDKRQIDHS